MTALANRLFEIAGSIRNVADVADGCVITEVVNSIPAMRVWADELDELRAALSPAELGGVGLTFAAFRAANVARCVKWHPEGIASWSPSDWLTAVTGELGELASLLKMRNRERDGLAGNKFSPTDKMVSDELADVLTYLDLLAEVLGVDLGRAAVAKFNEVSERVGFTDRIDLSTPRAAEAVTEEMIDRAFEAFHRAPLYRSERERIRATLEYALTPPSAKGE